MTHRDLAWKAGGAALTLSACVGVSVTDSPMAVAMLPLALLGLPLMLNGKRVPQLLKAERRGHPHTAAAVHAAHVRARRQNTDGFGL